MQAGQHLRQSLEITIEPSKARQPPETALDHPASGQQDKPLLRLGQFDDLQVDLAGLGVLPGLLAGVTLIRPRQTVGGKFITRSSSLDAQCVQF